MTIREVLQTVNEIKSNQIPDVQKLAWLSECDQAIYREIIATHESNDDFPIRELPRYDEQTPTDTRLIAIEPYSALYRYYLEAQIDLANKELAKYNNSSALYNAQLHNFAAWYNRTYTPVQRADHFRL